MEKYVTMPLRDFKSTDINNILIYTMKNEKAINKLGEELINVYPLITMLLNHFSRAFIYPLITFSEIYKVDFFNDRVKPISNLDELCNIKIDLVFDINAVKGYFFSISKKYLYCQSISIIEFFQPTSAASAFLRDIKTIHSEPLSIIINGIRYNITGTSDLISKVAPHGAFQISGIWNFSIGLCRLLGLEEPGNPLKISERELFEGKMFLERIYEEQFNEKIEISNEFIIIFNVYSVTQANLIHNELFATIIEKLLSETNAMLIFPRGGFMDENILLVDIIFRQVKCNQADIRRCIFLPRIDLLQIHSVIGNANLIITVDTGFSHISGLYNHDAIIITMPSIRHWLPLGNKSNPIWKTDLLEKFQSVKNDFLYFQCDDETLIKEIIVHVNSKI